MFGNMLIPAKVEDAAPRLFDRTRDNACSCRALANVRRELRRVVDECFGEIADLLTLLALVSPDQVIFDAVRVDSDSRQLAIRVGNDTICHQRQIEAPGLESSQQEVVSAFELFTIDLVVAKLYALPNELHCRFLARCGFQGRN